MSNDETIQQQLTGLRQEIQDLTAIVKPIAETYQTASSISNIRRINVKKEK